MSHSAFIGISRHHLGCLVAELAGPWQARRESDLRRRRGHERRRAEGAGRSQELVFTDRVLVSRKWSGNDVVRNRRDRWEP